MLFGRSIGSLCALHLGILGYGEAPENPPSNHPYGGGLAIYDHPSRSHMLYLHAGLVPPIHYITGIDAVFTTAYMPIQSIYNVLLPMRYLYSSHVLATIKISCAIHTC